MRLWTDEERQRQSKIIHKWKPWNLSTGPKSAEGKAKTAMNSRVHGLYSTEYRYYRLASKELGHCINNFFCIMQLMEKNKIDYEDINILEKQDKIDNSKVDKIIKDIQQRLAT